MLTKFMDTNVAKRAADLIVPILSAGNSPRSGSADGTTSSPRVPLSPFGSGSVHHGSAAGAGAKQACTRTLAASCESISSISSSGGSSQQCDGSLGSCPSTTSQASPASISLQQLSQQAPQPQPAAAQQLQQQQQPLTPTAAAAAAAAAAGATFNSFTVAKKTIGKIFGGGSNWSADGSGHAVQGSSPTGTGLIAAFRAIIPNTSNGSTGEGDEDVRSGGTGGVWQAGELLGAAWKDAHGLNWRLGVRLGCELG